MTKVRKLQLKRDMMKNSMRNDDEVSKIAKAVSGCDSTLFMLNISFFFVHTFIKPSSDGILNITAFPPIHISTNVIN